MRKRIQKSKYIIAFMITFLLFMSGVLLGLNFQYKRAQSLDSAVGDIKQSYSSVLIQYQYMQQLEEEKDCTALNLLFQSALEELNVKRERLEIYDNQDKLDKADFAKLRSSYTVSQLNYWLLAKKLKSLCEFDYSIILYFFDEPEDCGDCEDQGIHLDYVKKLLEEDVLIFALNGNEDGMVSLLKQKYGVTYYPLLIIDEEKHDFKTNKEILEMICPGKTDTHEVCLKYVEEENMSLTYTVNASAS